VIWFGVDGNVGLWLGGFIYMDVQKIQAFEIIVDATTDGLAQKVTEKLELHSGAVLVAGPFVFNGCVCQAVSLLGAGT
jgi:hypothetical protein